MNQILRTLKSIKLADFKKIYNTSTEKAKLIHKQNLNIKKEFCSYAIERYTGTVFTHIDWQSFSHSEKEFFLGGAYSLNFLYAQVLANIKLGHSVHWSPYRIIGLLVYYIGGVNLS